MKDKRSRAKIMYDMLSCILKKDNQLLLTRIQQSANLPHDRTTQYLKNLTLEGLVVYEEESGHYTVTEKGIKFCHEFRNAETVLDAFGIRI
jgi:predicted transcriptional regulator